MQERSRGNVGPVGRVVRRALAIALCLLIPVMPAAAEMTAQEAQDAADWRALQAELGRHIQVRGDARQQLVAAMLLAWPIADDAPAAHKAAAAARMPEAQAIFARVRAGTDDPWLLWIAATDCRFGAAICDRDGAIDDLLRIEPHNAAVWLLALDRAQRRHDKDAQLAALEGMAASTRYDQYYITAIRAWTDAFVDLPQLPDFERLVARTMTNDPAAALDAESLRALAGLHGLAAAAAFGFPPFAALTKACMPEEITSEAWRDACRGAAQVLVASDTMVSLGLGLPVAYRFAADDAERSTLEQRRLEKDWLKESMVLLSLDGFDAEGVLDIDEANEVVRRWREGGSELRLLHALMHEHSMPLTPPPDYRARGMTLAEREADRRARLAAPAGREAMK